MEKVEKITPAEQKKILDAINKAEKELKIDPDERFDRKLFFSSFFKSSGIVVLIFFAVVLLVLLVLWIKST